MKDSHCFILHNNMIHGRGYQRGADTPQKGNLNIKEDNFKMIY